MNRDHDPNEALDRLWAATRPEEPSADAFDRLWGKVRDRASQPQTLSFTPVATWKRWGITLAVTAQAAALLIAAFVALNRPEPVHPMQVAKNDHVAPPLVLHDYLVAQGTTFFVNLDPRGRVQDAKAQPQMPESSTDIQTAEADVLNFMESYE